MFSFFSRSRSRGHYPNPSRGGTHYQRRGLFGSSGSFGSFSRSHDHIGQGYPQQTPSRASSVAICPNCGTAVPAGSKFCLSCGAKMESAAFCSNCGKPLPPNAKFCPECGTPRR